MHRIWNAALALTLLSLPLTAAAGDKKTDAMKWTLDADHTEVAFVATHLKVTKVHGSFADPEGTFDVDPKDFTKSKFDVKIDASTITTGVDARDNHLKSKDFFNVEKHPWVTFKSTKVVKAKEGYALSGDLQMAGVTKPVTFTCNATPEFKGVFGEPRVAFECTSTIDRTQWGMKWNKVTEGLELVSNNVDVRLTAELKKIKKTAKK